MQENSSLIQLRLSSSKSPGNTADFANRTSLDLHLHMQPHLRKMCQKITSEYIHIWVQYMYFSVLQDLESLNTVSMLLSNRTQCYILAELKQRNSTPGGAPLAARKERSPLLSGPTWLCCSDSSLLKIRTSASMLHEANVKCSQLGSI